jgi:hypothetical protein
LFYAFLLCVFFSMQACSSHSAPDPIKSSDIIYFKDARTQQCFAATNSLDGHSGWYTTSITYVPCTTAVEALIK